MPAQPPSHGPVATETLTYTSPSGSTITFGDTSFPNVLYKGIQGIGLSTVDNFVVDTAYQPGAQFVRTKVKPAVLKVKLIFEGDDTTLDYRQSLWNTVDAIAGVLQPQITQAGTLTKTLSDGTQRSLHSVQYVGGLEIDDEAANRAYVSVDLIFEAYDPTWYNTSQHSVSVGTSSDPFGFSVPITIPLTINGQASGTANISNAGNINSNLIITFLGPCQNFSFSNNTTGLSFAISQVLNAGDSLVVDTGQGTITWTPAGGSPTNLYSAFSGSKQWVQLAPGANSILFKRDAAAANQCTVKFYDTWNHG